VLHSESAGTLHGRVELAQGEVSVHYANPGQATTLPHSIVRKVVDTGPLRSYTSLYDITVDGEPGKKNGLFWYLFSIVLLSLMQGLGVFFPGLEDKRLCEASE